MFKEFKEFAVKGNMIDLAIAVIGFLIIAWVIFVAVKAMNKLRREKEAEVTTKECQYCKSEIALGATKCPACTSSL